MSPRLAKLSAAAAILLAGLALSGCIESQVFLSPDYGVAVRQNAVAQIADPDARYKGTPPAGSDGARADLAQLRYSKGQVIQPASTSTSEAVSGGDSGGATAPAPPAQ